MGLRTTPTPPCPRRTGSHRARPAQVERRLIGPHGVVSVHSAAFCAPPPASPCLDSSESVFVYPRKSRGVGAAFAPPRHAGGDVRENRASDGPHRVGRVFEARYGRVGVSKSPDIGKRVEEAARKFWKWDFPTRKGAFEWSFRDYGPSSAARPALTPSRALYPPYAARRSPCLLERHRPRKGGGGVRGKKTFGI